MKRRIIDYSLRYYESLLSYNAQQAQITFSCEGHERRTVEVRMEKLLTAIGRLVRSCDGDYAGTKEYDKLKQLWMRECRTDEPPDPIGWAPRNGYEEYSLPRSIQHDPSWSDIQYNGGGTQ